MITIHPTKIAAALSHAYGGTCRLQPMSPLKWAPCPDCARYLGQRMTICQVCDGSGRIAYL